MNKQPIDNIQWVDVDKLTANDYNPNVVFNQELKLLKFSILKQGWIQPILVTQNYEIIDGYHRASLAKTDKDVNNLTKNKVPVVIMEMSEAERKCLTIRINRAKGSHIALKMSDIIKSLVEEHGMSFNDIAKEIGATKDEIELLLMDNVFKSLDIENKEFSKAWYPTR
jgi:ParB-like chromosome segregation protein Spo0J